MRAPGPREIALEALALNDIQLFLPIEFDALMNTVDAKIIATFLSLMIRAQEERCFPDSFSVAESLL